MKTKPTQHSVNELPSAFSPIFSSAHGDELRGDEEDRPVRVHVDASVSEKDDFNIYEVPLLPDHGVDDFISNLGIKARRRTSA